MRNKKRWPPKRPSSFVLFAHFVAKTATQGFTCDTDRVKHRRYSSGKVDEDCKPQIAVPDDTEENKDCLDDKDKFTKWTKDYGYDVPTILKIAKFKF